MKKTLMVALAFVLVIAMSVAGTFAYLTAKTDAVVNTFTVGKVDIDLTETKDLDLKMIPGKTITKDPKVTVIAGSEDSWVFVKINASENLGTYIDYTVDTSVWTALDNVEGVYWCKVTNVTADQALKVLANDEVTVKNVTSEQMAAATGENAPTLTFTAYAIQQAGFETAAAAWAEVSK